MPVERNSDLKHQCENDMCMNVATVVCESHLLFGYEWKGCGKHLCDDCSNQNEFFAVIGFGRCKSGPCDTKLKKVLAKQLGIFLSLFILPLVLFFIIAGLIFGEAAFESHWFHVTRDQDDKVTAMPMNEISPGDWAPYKDIVNINHESNLTPAQHKSTLIWLHDLEGQSTDYLRYFIKDNRYKVAPLTTKIVFPEATSEINDFYSMRKGDRTRSWFNEYNFPNISRPFVYNVTGKEETWKKGQFDREELKDTISNVTQIRIAAKQLWELVDKEIRLLPSQNSTDIYLGGVGQGAMVLLSAFASHRKPLQLGGIVGLLSYLPIPNRYINYASQVAKTQSMTPMLLFNNDNDDQAPLTFAKDTYSFFKQLYVPRTEKEKEKFMTQEEIKDGNYTSQWDKAEFQMVVGPNKYIGHDVEYDGMWTMVKEFFIKSGM